MLKLHILFDFIIKFVYFVNIIEILAKLCYNNIIKTEYLEFDEDEF